MDFILVFTFGPAKVTTFSLILCENKVSHATTTDAGVMLNVIKLHRIIILFKIFLMFVFELLKHKEGWAT